jgi:16S rRNA (guanine966-N2)-methyltransferase
MRIIAGKYGRRTLSVPQDRNIRPTSDKIRGAIFNALESQGAINDAQVLDAFCGTAALGLEALSRGAAHCTFIDKAKTSLDLARNNIEALGARTESDLLLGDASTLNFKGKTFDLILLDPPYHKGLIELTLNNLIGQSAISSTAHIMCESETGLPMVQNGSFETHSHKSYGDTQITILSYKASTPE